jgi:hypothetical protein
MDTIFNVLFIFFALSGFISWGIVFILFWFYWATNSFRGADDE